MQLHLSWIGNSALVHIVLCAILAKLTLLENLKWHTILHVFIKNLHWKNQYFIQNQRKQKTGSWRKLYVYIQLFGNSALVVCTIIKFFKNLKWQIILHFFIKNLYHKNKHIHINFHRFARESNVGIQLSWNFGTPVTWQEMYKWQCYTNPVIWSWSVTKQYLSLKDSIIIIMVLIHN